MSKHATFAVLVLAVFAFAVGCSSSESSSQKTDSKANQTAPDNDKMSVALVGHSAPDFTLTGTDGKTHTLSDYSGKYVVLEWVNFDCPFVGKQYHSGNMPSLQKSYRNKDVVWLSICSSAPGKQGYFEGEALDKRMDSEGWKGTAYLIDANGKVGHMYGAKATPNMFVIDPEGTLLYAGAIDDKPTTKLEDVDGAVNYVSMALDASMAGKEIATKTTQPYGCSVKYQ